MGKKERSDGMPKESRVQTLMKKKNHFSICRKKKKDWSKFGDNPLITKQ